MDFFKSFVGWFAALTAADILKEYNSFTGIGYREPQGYSKSPEEILTDRVAWMELYNKTPYHIWQQKMRDDPTGDHSEAYRESMEWLEKERLRLVAYAKEHGF